MNKAFIISSAMFAAVLATPVQAADCNAPASFIEVKACNAAKQGIDALRRFVWRTRMIYSLYLPDYVHAIPPGNR